MRCSWKKLVCDENKVSEGWRSSLYQILGVNRKLGRDHEERPLPFSHRSDMQAAVASLLWRTLMAVPSTPHLFYSTYDWRTKDTSLDPQHGWLEIRSWTVNHVLVCSSETSCSEEPRWSSSQPPRCWEIYASTVDDAATPRYQNVNDSIASWFLR
jgi:hypothetical protein